MTAVGVIGIIVEFWLLFAKPLANTDLLDTMPRAQYWAMAIPLFLAVAGVLGIVAWIGITMVQTPPPEMMEFEDFEEVDLEETSEEKPAKKETKPKAEKKTEKKPEKKAETKSEGRALEDIDGVTPSVIDGLKEAGFDTVEKLSKATLDDLTKIKGIGKKTAERIMTDSQK